MDPRPSQRPVPSINYWMSPPSSFPPCLGTCSTGSVSLSSCLPVAPVGSTSTGSVGHHCLNRACAGFVPKRFGGDRSFHPKSLAACGWVNCTSFHPATQGCFSQRPCYNHHVTVRLADACGGDRRHRMPGRSSASVSGGLRQRPHLPNTRSADIPAMVPRRLWPRAGAGPLRNSLHRRRDDPRVRLQPCPRGSCCLGCTILGNLLPSRNVTYCFAGRPALCLFGRHIMLGSCGEALLTVPHTRMAGSKRT